MLTAGLQQPNPLKSGPCVEVGQMAPAASSHILHALSPHVLYTMASCKSMQPLNHHETMHACHVALT